MGPWCSKLYAVKVQRSLAPLSWFPGSRKPTAHVGHQWCRFQSYAKSRRLHAIANEIYKRNLHCVNRIPGIHDNGPPRTTLWRLTLTAYTVWQMTTYGPVRRHGMAHPQTFLKIDCIDVGDFNNWMWSDMSIEQVWGCFFFSFKSLNAPRKKYHKSYFLISMQMISSNSYQLS